MTYKAYIQAMNGVPIDDWGFTAYLGFKKRQMDIIFFEDIEEVPKSKFNIVVGYIDDTRKYFERLGIEVPLPLNIPESLLPYAKRKIEVMTMKEFKNNVTLPIFIKPAKVVKGFMAGVLQNENSLKSFYGFNEQEEVNDETMVMTSEVLDIVSEYRGFVVGKQLQSLQHYKGDFRRYPDVSIIENAIADYKDQPAGYSIDFGVTANGDSILIECNDAWSLGCYGCDATIYTNMICKRWLELVKI